MSVCAEDIIFVGKHSHTCTVIIIAVIVIGIIIVIVIGEQSHAHTALTQPATRVGWASDIAPLQQIEHSHGCTVCIIVIGNRIFIC